MRRIGFGILALIACVPAPAQDKTADEVIAMERGALERWAKGDTLGYVEIATEDTTYFDPATERRVDGLDAFRRDLEPARGTFHIDRWEMLNPKVQTCDHLAVLTYNDVSRTGDRESRWNVTEIYRKTPRGWRLMSSHFSLTQPDKQKRPAQAANSADRKPIK